MSPIIPIIVAELEKMPLRKLTDVLGIVQELNEATAVGQPQSGNRSRATAR